MNLGEVCTDTSQIPRKRFRQYHVRTDGTTENESFVFDPNSVGYQVTEQSQMHPPSQMKAEETVNEMYTFYPNYTGYQYAGGSQMQPPHNVNSVEAEDKPHIFYPDYSGYQPIDSNHMFLPNQMTESRGDDQTQIYYPNFAGYEHSGISQMMHYSHQINTEEVNTFYPVAAGYQVARDSLTNSPCQTKKEETEERTHTPVAKFAGYQPLGGKYMFHRHLLQMKKEATENKTRTLDPNFSRHEHTGGNQMRRKSQAKKEETVSESVDPNCIAYEHVQDSQMRHKSQIKKVETHDEVEANFSGYEHLGGYQMHRNSQMRKEETEDETQTEGPSCAGYEHVLVSQVRHKSEVKKVEIEDETYVSDPNYAGYVEHTRDNRMHRKSQLINKETEYKTPTLDPNFAGYQLVGDSQMVRFGEQLLGLQRLTTPTKKMEDEIHTLEPSFHGYQLVGDSQMVRFGEQILGLQRLQTPTKSGRIGICVSGQTISELHRRVRQNFYPVDKKIVLMIGTNDLLRNAEVSTMCHDLSSLVKSLQESAHNIVILTLPPVPKLSFKEEHWTKLDKYNKHILSLDNGKNIVVGDIAPLFYSASIKRCRLNLFELYFSGPARRKDLIHLNFKGLQLIRNYMLDYL